jgi:hypothetical protein
VSLKALRDRGVPAARIVGLLAASAGMGGGEPHEPNELVAGFDLSRVPRGPALLEV